jgi:hypothetical protein
MNPVVVHEVAEREAVSEENCIAASLLYRCLILAIEFGEGICVIRQIRLIVRGVLRIQFFKSRLNSAAESLCVPKREPYVFIVFRFFFCFIVGIRAGAVGCIALAVERCFALTAGGRFAYVLLPIFVAVLLIFVFFLHSLDGFLLPDCVSKRIHQVDYLPVRVFRVFQGILNPAVRFSANVNKQI